MAIDRPELFAKHEQPSASQIFFSNVGPAALNLGQLYKADRERRLPTAVPCIASGRPSSDVAWAAVTYPSYAGCVNRILNYVAPPWHFSSSLSFIESASLNGYFIAV